MGPRLPQELAGRIGQGCAAEARMQRPMWMLWAHLDHLFHASLKKRGQSSPNVADRNAPLPRDSWGR
eukprot:4664138-Pyramimonas_sp.AAC.1